MTNLADLDRRAALTMGRRECPFHGLWIGRGKCKPNVKLCGPYSPTTNDHDRREFVQWVLRNEGWTLDLYVWSGAADATVGPGSSVDCGIGTATKAEYGPTYDLVAQVLAVLDAVEARND